MSTFELAIPTILRHEGRFVNNPADFCFFCNLKKCS